MDLLQWVCLWVTAPPAEAAELGSGSPRQAVELIPAISGCNCSCGTRREQGKVVSISCRCASLAALDRTWPWQVRSCPWRPCRPTSLRTVLLLPTDLVPPTSHSTALPRVTSFCHVSKAVPKPIQGSFCLNQWTRRPEHIAISWAKAARKRSRCLFHKHSSNRTFCQQRETGPFPELGLLCARRDLCFLTTPRRCSHKRSHHLLAGQGAMGTIQHPQKDFCWWNRGCIQLTVCASVRKVIGAVN